MPDPTSESGWKQCSGSVMQTSSKRTSGPQTVKSADCALHKEANQIRVGSPVDVTALHKVRGDTVKA
jgi:hypothetical protein